jgi:transposase
MSTAAPLPDHPARGPDVLPPAEHLPDDPATLKRMILELLATLQQANRDRDALRHRLDQLVRRLYGPRGERFDPNQPLLFAEVGDTGETVAPPAAASAAESPESPRQRRCTPHGRRRLPVHLRRTQQHHTLSEAERVCPGCGQVRVEIGVDTSEQLDYQPASFFVVEHFIHTYACPHCAAQPQARPSPEAADPKETAAREPTPVVAAVGTATAAAVPVVVSGVKPASPIAKGLPGAGLLAYIIVNKYVDHLPLHRQERICERQGVFLARSTTCDWMAACAELLRPLYEVMVARVLQSRVIHTDDTPVKMDQPPPGATRTGRQWVYLGDADHPYNVFDFTPNHQRDGPQQFLAGYRGYLQADAFSGYDALYLPKSDGVVLIREVACNAHARRKFYEARSSDAVRSHQALAYYHQLYEIERRAKEANADAAQRLQMRQDLALPILEQFQSWLARQRAEVLPKSPMAEALGYALNNWQALIRYTEAGFLAIDNNVAEREMKRIAIGRKNWLFVGSVRGGQTAAVLFSLTSTCTRLAVEPWTYLQDVLTRLPTLPADQLADLLPDRWQATRAAATTIPPP